MDSKEFRKYGKEMIDFVADYWDSLDGEDQRKPLSDAQPGYIWDLVPNEAPKEPESWDKIFKDLEPVILNANTNWHHPNFHAYYPTACSYPAIMGDILSGGIASIGFTWKSSPSMTELEMIMTDWLAKAIGLPDCFLNSDSGPGAGMIQSTASDATLVALLSARARAVNNLTKSNNGILSQWVFSTIEKALNKVHMSKKIIQEKLPNFGANSNSITSSESPQNMEAKFFEDHNPKYFHQLVAYCSDQAHSSVEKGIMLSGVRIRKLKSSKENFLGNYTIEAETLEQAILEDQANGLIPFILIATIGSTNTCGVDFVEKLGPICNREKLWLHVDAAYAGSYLLCEEFRYLIKGVEMVDSFNFNAHKAMMINFDCSPMWFKDAIEAIKYFNVDPVYLKHEHQAVASDYRHLQVALGRRFRALKIWFVLRALGIAKIQAFQRQHVKLAIEFAQLIENNSKFELFVPQHLGLVCFRLRGDDELNERLNTAINSDGRIHLVPSKTHSKFFLRFAVCGEKTNSEHVKLAAKVIFEIAEKLLLLL